MTETTQITRLVVPDYKGNYGSTFARSGERVYAYHKNHKDDESSILYPKNQGIMFLYGGLLIDVLDGIYEALGGPLDYIMLRGKQSYKYGPLLRLSKAVDTDKTAIAYIGSF